MIQIERLSHEPSFVQSKTTLMENNWDMQIALYTSGASKRFSTSKRFLTSYFLYTEKKTNWNRLFGGSFYRPVPMLFTHWIQIQLQQQRDWWPVIFFSLFHAMPCKTIQAQTMEWEAHHRKRIPKGVKQQTTTGHSLKSNNLAPLTWLKSFLCFFA